MKLFQISYLQFDYDDITSRTINSYPKVIKSKIIKDSSLLSVVRKLKKQNRGKIQMIDKPHKYKREIWLLANTEDDDKNNIAHRTIEIIEGKYKDPEFKDGFETYNSEGNL